MGEFAAISNKSTLDQNTERQAENAIKVIQNHQQTQTPETQAKMQPGIDRLIDLYKRGQYTAVVKASEDFARQFNFYDKFVAEMRRLELESKVLIDTKKKGGMDPGQKTDVSLSEDKKKKGRQAKVREDALSKAPKTKTPREEQAEKPKPPKIPPQEEQNKVEKKVFTEQGPKQE